jgi:putative ABC transport system ATP-binding protein
MTGALGLSLRRVSVTFDRSGSPVQAVRRIDLEIPPGQYVVVVGPNGAGKSTLVNVIAGSIRPTSGSVAIGGRTVTELPDHARARWVARVFQDPSDGTCPGMTVLDHALLLLHRGRRRSPWRRARTRSAVERFRTLLAGYGRGLEHRLSDDVAKLSGGERQLLSVLLAVLGEPAVLLLDEHVSALDPDIGTLVMQQTDDLVRTRGLTTVMVTHNLRHALRYGDRLLVMGRGQIVDDIGGKDKEVLDEPGLIDRFRRLAEIEVTDKLLG